MLARAWGLIETKLRAASPHAEIAFPAGATPEAIRHAEQAIGLPFPTGMSESYLHHDGSGGIWICEQGFLMPVSTPEKFLGSYGVLNIWEAMLQVAEAMSGERSRPAGPIRTDWWHPKWLPITENECGDYLCVDMDPFPDGRVGQVIEWSHELGAVRVVSPSFEDWLAGLGT